MAIEYFLKFEGVQGESLASAHTGEIELLSFSWGVSNPAQLTGSGLSAGKPSSSEVIITKAIDKSSPKLLGFLCSGKHFNEATISCQKSTGDKKPQDFLTIKFTEVYVSSYQTGGSSGDALGSESISLTYGKINYDYKIQNKDGTLASAGAFAYDFVGREMT